jgi:hypothetical protein
MPSAPACSQSAAAAATLGSGARRACLTVATWSMLMLSLAVMAASIGGSRPAASAIFAGRGRANGIFDF